MPLHDGVLDRPEDATYAGMVYLNANSAKAPGIVDTRLQRVIDEADCYSGCTFRASIGLFAYDKGGGKGVGAALNNLQVIKKGDRIDGRKDAAEEFAEFQDGDAPATAAEGAAAEPAATEPDVGDLLG